MATPTPNQRTPSTTGPSATSTRSGEPGSAFSGSSRGGRGRGSGRGRGGRGGRGGTREKVIGAASSSDKPNLTSTSKSTPTLSTKPVTLPPPTATEKTPVVSNASHSARPKRNLRRASRSVPAAVVPPVSTVDQSNPDSSKSASRKRRSQTGKTVPTKISVPSHDDNLLRPQRPCIGSVPHTVPIKDSPPHLSNSTNKHTDDIDAVLERVRAVNVDDRPHTPGSHIDWAGDDDDSLPDLDDWGITSIKVATNENGLISPLGVNGLRPLPDMVIDVETSSPHQKTPERTNSVIYDQNEITPHQAKSPDNSISTPDGTHVVAPITTTQEPLVSAPASAKVSLCPSLPPHAAGATNQDVVASKEIEVTAPVAKVERGLTASIHSPNTSVDKEDPFSNLLTRNGLAASIHAPHPTEMTETKSASSDISLNTRASLDPRTHNRSHPTGRPPSYPRADNNGRPSRSGYNTPRGGLYVGGSYHARTHSTPPAGSHTHRSPAHRPVLTGDALSRIAKTIGGTTPSSARVPAISSAAQE